MTAARDMPPGLARLNALPPTQAEAEMMRCCGCASWAARVASQRPFADAEWLLRAADAAWRETGPEQWREAFSHHPRIGERKVEQAAGASTAAWAQREQSGMGAASEEVRRALAEGNAEYERRFGHVFLICATGRSAESMLAELKRRLKNDPETELRMAAEQQAMITRLRLEKLVNE
jgi:OHCU decarboxylase